MLRVLDLFSGIGSFSLAFERAGAEIAAHSEIDKNCQKLLADKFPTVEQLGDICDVKKESIRGSIDLIAGGSPCQNLSIAGRGEGLAGTESRLWFEYLRLAQTLKPRWLVWENVPNALSSNNGRDFRTILMGLDDCGYHVAWRVLDSQYFGVPQRRRRIFLVANLGNGTAAKVLFERESVQGTYKTRPGTWKASTIAGTIAANAGGTARPAGQANELDFLVFQKARSDEFVVNGADSVASTLSARDGKDFGDLLAFSPASYKRDVEKNFLHHASISATLRAKNNSGSTDSEEHLVINGMIRRLTPLECERLQGFPDFWTQGFSDSARYSMLGNSIAVPVSEWIAQRIMTIEAGGEVS